MKKTTAIILFVLMFTACKKENSVRKFYKEFSGKWEYERYSGYPFTDTYQPPGNGNLIVLRSNKTFERRKNDTILYKGTYFLKQKVDCGQTENEMFMLTDENPSYELIIKIKDGKLLLSTSACLADGGTTTYRKLEDE